MSLSLHLASLAASIISTLSILRYGHIVSNDPVYGGYAFGVSHLLEEIKAAAVRSYKGSLLSYTI